MTEYKDALDGIPDGCDIHDAVDWLVKNGTAVKRALKIADRLMQEPSDGMVIAGRKQTMIDCAGPHMGPNAEKTYSVMRDQLLKEVETEQ